MQYNKKLKLYRYIDALAYRTDMSRRRGKANRHAAALPIVPLSKFEKKEVRDKWGKYDGGNFRSFAFYKYFCGRFDPLYVPDDYYDFAEHVLNLRWAAYFLQHKFNLKYIIPKDNRAETILQRIDGHFVLEDNTEISRGEAISLLNGYSSFIAKNAFGPGGGKGVRKVSVQPSNRNEDFYKDLFSWNDMVFERIIEQSDFMKAFNPDSVNTIRFVTLNINRNCTVLSSFIRMGAKGSYVDNLHGGGGVLVGVNENGLIFEFGINHKFEKKYYSPTGLEFKGMVVPDFMNLKNTIIELHKRIPFANLIGWDIAISKDGTPKVIEINLDSAVLEAHQIFNGPIFGERLEEVKTYIENRRPMLRHIMITY